MSTPGDDRYRPSRTRIAVWVVLVLVGIGLIVAGIVLTVNG